MVVYKGYQRVAGIFPAKFHHKDIPGIQFFPVRSPGIYPEGSGLQRVEHFLPVQKGNVYPPPVRGIIVDESVPVLFQHIGVHEPAHNEGILHFGHPHDIRQVSISI